MVIRILLLVSALSMQVPTDAGVPETLLAWARAEPLTVVHLLAVADVQDGVVFIRPTRSRAQYLDSRPLIGRLAAQGLFPIGEKVFAPLDRRLDRDLSGGRVGGGPGVIGVEIDRGENLQVTVDADGLTVLEVLNAIARQAPGHAWWVITTDDANPRIASFGFVHRFGTGSLLRIGSQ